MVGGSASAETIATFSAGSEAACLIDDGSVASAWKARKDELYLVAADGNVLQQTWLQESPLSKPDAVLQLDTAVRDAVAR